MNYLKSALLTFTTSSLLLFISGCEMDEGKLPNISFKTGGNYLTSNDTLVGKSSLLIGIDASKSETEDVLKKFDVSKSVNGASAVSVFNKSLSGNEGNNYNYDYNSTVDSIPGTNTKYIFTVTNRDGLTNQVSITVTTK